jgi:hypothetical protein
MVPIDDLQAIFVLVGEVRIEPSRSYTAKQPKEDVIPSRNSCQRGTSIMSKKGFELCMLDFISDIGVNT